MSSLLAEPIRYIKPIVIISVFAIVTFLFAGLFMTLVPASYHTAILIGWILSIAIVGKILRTRYLSSQPV